MVKIMICDCCEYEGIYPHTTTRSYRVIDDDPDVVCGEDYVKHTFMYT